MKGFNVSTKRKKNQEIAFQGPQRIVAGTGAGRQTLLGVDKRPEILGNGFMGFPMASLDK